MAVNSWMPSGPLVALIRYRLVEDEKIDIICRENLKRTREETTLQMESKKQVGSSSSFTADMFGSNESPPSSSSKGIFNSIFPPPSMTGGRNSSWPKQPSGAPFAETAPYSLDNKERNSVFQEQRMEPCHLSSSIYYGGQDIYVPSSTTQTSTSYPIFKKDGEDDPNGSNSRDASGGNWWQGSLYY